MIESTWNAVLHVFGTLPLWLAAVLIGWAMSIALTQSIKFALPVGAAQGAREAATRWVAFLTAAIPSGLWMAQEGAGGLAVALVAIGAGAWSPIAYSLLVAGLRRWDRTAWAADVLSGDKRGVLAKKLKGKP